MKRYITRFLKSLAVVLIGFPFFYIILAAMIYDIPLKGCGKILLSPFYYFVSLSAVIAGYGLWEARRWSWYVFVLFQVLLGLENASILLNYSESHHKISGFVFSLLLQGLLIFRVAKEIRVPYFFPKIRWWESNPRYRLSTPVKISRKNKQGVEEVLEGEILDVSVAGCFVKLRQDLRLDEKIVLQFHLFHFDFSCEGTAVWCTQSAVTHPKGVGIKFGILSRNQKRVLRFISRRLRKIAKFYRKSRYWMSQEEFVQKLHELETRGRSPMKTQSKEMQTDG